MIRNLRLIAADPILRLVVGAVLLFGIHAASVAIYQSLIAISVFGISDRFYSFVLLIALFVSVGTSVGVGIVTDQRPSRRAMALTASALMVAGSALVWMGDSPVYFVIAHMLLLPASGSLFGQLFAVARLASAPLAPHERDAILTIVRATFAVPFMIVLPLWGMAFDSGLSLLTIYPVVLLVSLSLLALIWRSWPADSAAPWTEQKSGIGFRASIGEMVAPPVLLRVMIMGAIHSGSAISGVVVGLIFNEASGRGAGDVGLFFGLFVAVEVVVTLSIGQLLRVMPRLWIITSGAGIYAVFLGLLPILAPTPWVWALVLPAGAGGAMVYALAIGYLQDLMGRRAGAGASLIALQRLSSDGLSALIFAIGTWISGYGLVSILGAATLFAAVAAILWLDRGREA
jgi:SET family sugar efflux transporter-like MFS transporter